MKYMNNVIKLSLVLLCFCLMIFSSFNNNTNAQLSTNTTKDNLSFSLLLGGENVDEGLSLIVDGDSNVIAVGRTYSEDFHSLNAYDSSLNKNDVFITKISTPNCLLWSTFLGGNDSDIGLGVVADSQNNIIVTGETESYDFPTINSYDTSLNGETDGFIAKFTASCSLLWSTFLGGNSRDMCEDVTLDSKDNIIVTGHTTSSDFPVLDGYCNSNQGQSDIFITKLAANGSLLWSTYLGGIKGDEGKGIMVDKQDNVIITGFTASSDFPVLNAFIDTHQGSTDVFVTKVSSNGTLIWSTFLGGEDSDSGESIAVNNQNSIIVTGQTESNYFPTVNANDSTYNGLCDGFITKFNSSGVLEWSSYLGGSENDFTQAVTVDKDD